MKENSHIHDMATKALYNNILLHTPHSHIAAPTDWKNRDWRAMPVEQLFSELTLLGVQLDKNVFLLWARESDSPEDLLELLLPDEIDHLSGTTLDHIYLILFELWRRFVPEKRTISILADEIDHTILSYDLQQNEIAHTKIAHGLIALLKEYVRLLQTSLDILEQEKDNKDKNDDDCYKREGFSSRSHVIFNMTQAYFVHDIARFLFDFIVEELQHDTADDLIPLAEGILPFITPSSWAECLKAHIYWYNDDERVCQKIATLAKHVIRQIQHTHEIDFTLLCGTLVLCAKTGDKVKFISLLHAFLVRKGRMSVEEAYELLSISLLYAEAIDHCKFIKELSQVMSEIENMNLEEKAVCDKKLDYIHHILMNVSRPSHTT